MIDESNAEPSPATELSEPPSLDNFTSEQRLEWLKSGAIPTESQPGTEESAPLQSPSAAEKAGIAPESEPGKQEPETPEERSKRDKARNEQRWTSLLEENRQVKRQASYLYNELQRFAGPAGDGKAESPPAQPQQVQLPEKPKKPKIADYETYEAFESANDVWDTANDQYHERVAEIKAQQAIQSARAEAFREAREEQIARYNHAVETSWEQRRQKAENRHPDFNTVALSDAVLDRIPEGSALDVAIVQRELGTEILYYLGQTPGEIERIVRLSPMDQAFEIAAIERSLSESLRVPQTRKFTAAGRPPVDLGGKNSAPDDEVAAAVADGDAGFRRFMRLENTRELARRKG